MELNAKTLQEVTFGAKVRGYDPAEVDDFIAAVAEGVDELHERLRRATERATRAEQQLAAAPVDVPSATPQIDPAPSTTGSPEISKVWERAVAAAEQAMEEAKAEAQRLLDESRTRADTQLNDARREADATVSTAKSEAVRITEESQAQLRIEIQKLESARDSLNTDVAGLTAFLESEKERIRARLNEALTAIEQYGSGANPFPEPAASTYVSDAVPAATSATDDWAAPTSTATSVTEPEWNNQFESNGSAFESSPSEVSEWSQSDANATDWQDETASSESEAENESESESDDAVQQETAEIIKEDDDSDPFLAELRRAVQDDGPLGPREEDAEESLTDLYSPDDDTNGFFRRNK